MENGSDAVKILQFGTGRFLRGFFDPIVPQEKSITVVQSRPNSNGARLINSHPQGYHVWTRGIQSGQVIDTHQFVRSIDRALDANTEWDQLLTVALNPELNLIISNTTAAGLELHPQDRTDRLPEVCPKSFPAKIACLLWKRFKAGLPGITLLPLELVDQNGTQLKELVAEQASIWTETREPRFQEYLETDHRWLNNLVDRIVVNPSEPPPWDQEDPLAVVGEPFRMLAIEDDKRDRSVIPPNPMVIWTDDLAPFFLRKVRILNGLHTAMVAKFHPIGIETVLQCVQQSESRQWLDELLHQEILPALAYQGLDETAFANEVMERFENPFFEHRLADIANGHETKLQVRIQPTAEDYRKAFPQEPVKLNEVLQQRLPV